MRKRLEKIECDLLLMFDRLMKIVPQHKQGMFVCQKWKGVKSSLTHITHISTHTHTYTHTVYIFPHTHTFIITVTHIVFVSLNYTNRTRGVTCELCVCAALCRCQVGETRDWQPQRGAGPHHQAKKKKKRKKKAELSSD